MNCPKCNSELLSTAVNCHRCGASFRHRSSQLRYAGFWRRVFAVAIDLLFAGAPIFVVFDRVIPHQSAEEEQATKAMFRHRLPSDEDARARLRFINRAVYFAEVTFFVCGPYFVLAESSTLQATFGKLLLGMKVTDLNGRRIRRRQALTRYLARILSALPPAVRIRDGDLYR